MIESLCAILVIAFARLATAVRGDWQGCAPEPLPRVYFANHRSHGDFILIWTVLHVYRFHRLLRYARLAPAELQDLVRELGRRLGLTRCPKLLQLPFSNGRTRSRRKSRGLPGDAA